MAEGRSIAAWWHTAALLAQAANQNRNPKKRRQPYSAEEFHPHFADRRQRKEGYRLTRDSVGVLKMFLKNRTKRKTR